MNVKLTYMKSKTNGKRLKSSLILEKGIFLFYSFSYLNAKSDEIKSKVKNMDAVSTGLKETVGKIKP